MCESVVLGEGSKLRPSQAYDHHCLEKAKCMDIDT